MSEQSRSSDPPAAGPPQRPRLLQQVHEAIRRKYFSRRIEETYVQWIKCFIHFTGKRHPATLGEAEVTKGGCWVKSPLDSGSGGPPPVLWDVTAEYRVG